MRLPQPELADPFLSLQGRRVDVLVAGQRIRGRLLSVRDGFAPLIPTEARALASTNTKSPAYPRRPGPLAGLPKSQRCFGNDAFSLHF